MTDPFLTLAGIASAILTVIFSWIIASAAIWIATDAISRKISFKRASYISFVAVIVFVILLFVFSFISPLLGLVIGFLGVLYIIKNDLHIGWFKAFVIAVIAFIIFVILTFIISTIFGIAAFLTFSAFIAL
ncbi:MAG: hypothetical protein QW597_02105 [Thermoplasmataceae archaeon]